MALCQPPLQGLQAHFLSQHSAIAHAIFLLFVLFVSKSDGLQLPIEMACKLLPMASNL